MKKSPHIIIIFVAAASVAAVAIIAAPARSFATAVLPVARLPYAKGQSFVVTQGYDTPPTHIKKDQYALDFTQNGCDAYGAPAVAATSGTAMFLSQEGYNGGYGTELIVNHGNNIVSRYAHMIPGSITVAASGTPVRRGQVIGLIGDTGLVAGAACADHPGTHLHFAMDVVNDDGTFSSYDPEPISGYTDMTTGKWYLSDNGDDDAASSSVAASSTNHTIAAGGISVAPAVVSADTASSPAPTSTAGAADTFDATSTSSIATSTTDVATGTDTVASSTPDDASSTASSTASSSAATSSAPAATSSPVLFLQSDDGARSSRSWYDDNWFELGNGFSGTLNTLTLEGMMSDVEYLATQVSLQEFKDKNYTAMVQEFPISSDAPFTATMATATFSGLSIPLKPYFYYRIFTMQDWQNRSVILAGTASTTVGAVMWDGFIPGTGRVEYTAPFFPFMEMDGVAATSTPVPPPLTTPTDLAESFDELDMRLDLSFGTSTDPDWPANPLHYEMNYSTSTTFSDAGWIAPGSIPLTIGNSYLIGVRAEDDYGDVSVLATTTWNFPAGFVPYLLSPELISASQYFTVPSTSTLRSIQLFTTNLQSGAPYAISTSCSLQLFDEADLSSLGMTPSDNSFTGRDCAGTPVFSFASTSPVLYPDHIYHWVFAATTGNPSTNSSVQFFGTAKNTAGGLFSDPSLVNAKFILTGDSGTLFEN